MPFVFIRMRGRASFDCDAHARIVLNEPLLPDFLLFPVSINFTKDPRCDLDLYTENCKNNDKIADLTYLFRLGFLFEL